VTERAPLGAIPRGVMMPTSSRSNIARCLSDRLVGVDIPSVILRSSDEFPLNLRQFASGFRLVVYLYPGASSSPQDGEDTPLVDSVQHRAFRDHQPELEARGYRAIGISSQPEEARRRAVVENRLTHRLLGDPKLQLAQDLGLPTFTIDGVHWYRRLTLVASQGRIVKVFYPVSSAERSAAQVIAWMKLHGNC
jgi:peroxiredoxin